MDTEKSRPTGRMPKIGCGIYSIKNMLNDKVYIGQSNQKRGMARWGAHKSALRRGQHKNPHMQRAWDLYGEQSFYFSVVEELPVTISPAALTERENFHRSQVPCSLCYNLAPCEPTAKRGPVGPDTRALLSKAMKGKRNFLGHKHSEETKAQMSAKRLGWVPSEETKSRMRAAPRQSPSQETVEKIKKANKGKKRSEESKARMRAAWVQRKEKGATGGR